VGGNVSLVCQASVDPILCLWKTPYGHVYTLGDGILAEGGRLRHVRPAQDVCGLQVVGVQARDHGQWQCEVGAVIQDHFSTRKNKVDVRVTGKTSR
jgi:hypothetical protein